MKILLDNTKVSYGSFTLDPGRLEIEKGRIYCLTGPNGSGKSTLLKIIGLQLKPESGTLSLGGETINWSDADKLLKQRRKISFMLQDSRLFHCSVYDNAAYALKIRGVPQEDIRKNVNGMLERFEIGHLAKRSLHGLSGGESQRVRLARNLVLDTPVYILDEPSAGLDTRGRELLADILTSYNREKGSTIIFCSHHKEEAYRMAPELISVTDGKIVRIPRENVLTGSAEKAGDRLYRFYNDKIDHLYFSCDHEPKGKISIAIDPDEIILSASGVHTSARNCLPGIVKEIAETPSSVQITVTAGEDFTVLITKNSLQEMMLSNDIPLFLIFKATAVKVVN
ncbi:MAG TPA: ATP-binding cassette domain-containing protein [Clostridiales bacterium]|nr:ATP-binding cassette domain-containing protein [Clostridiales bacterium]